MKIKKLKDAIKAAQLHGLDSEPDHEVGDLQDMLRIVWKGVPKNLRPGVLTALQQYVDETCGVENYSREYDVNDHPCLNGTAEPA